MLRNDLENVSLTDLEALRDAQVGEGATLDYKLELVLSQDQQKIEFAEDVASLANTSGGDLVIGVSEQGPNGKVGYPTAFPGIENDNLDRLRLQIESVVRDRLEPRLFGLRMAAVTVAEGRSVLIVRVPKSWHVHAVRRQSQGADRVVVRIGAQKSGLQFGEIRDRILAADALGERMRLFREERVAHIAANGLFLPMRPQPTVVLHVMPLGAFAGGGSMANLGEYRRVNPEIKPLHEYGCSWTHNADGMLGYSVHQNRLENYVQVFRNGCFESATTTLARPYDHSDGMYVPDCVDEILSHFAFKYLNIMRLAGEQTPVYVGVSLVHVRNVHISSERGWSSGGKTPIDRDVVLLPTMEFREWPPNAAFVAEHLRPMYDALYQSAGHPRCPHYDSEGRTILKFDLPF